MHPANLAVCCDRDITERSQHRFDIIDVPFDPRVVDEIFLHQHAGERRKEPSIGARLDL